MKGPLANYSVIGEVERQIIHCMSFYSLFSLIIRNIHVITVFSQQKTENEKSVLHMHFGKLKRTDEKILNL